MRKNKIRVGAGRDGGTGPGEVVSGPVGKHVHYEAPAAARLDEEIGTFVDWFNSGTDIVPLWKAGLAHLWFVTIHPFDDGNGPIARAIADLVLARSELEFAALLQGVVGDPAATRGLR